MAIGADRAILVETDEELQPLAVAKLLKALVDKEQPGAGHPGQAGHRRRRNQTGQMLAALADLPQATFASKVEVADGKAKVTRRSRRRPGNADAHAARRHHDRPAPERAALRDAAQHHEGQEEAARHLKPEDLGVDVKPRLKTLKVSEPPKRGAGIKVPDVAALVDKLKNEAKVI
jgi:electron transfer flavoprotein beta subunit